MVSRVFSFTHSRSSICTSTPSGKRFASPGTALLHTNTPELPPASRCFHSTCMMKFSYCFSLRITPIGFPEHLSSSPFRDQVSLLVLTLIHRIGACCFLLLKKLSLSVSVPNSTCIVCETPGQ